MQNRSAFIAAAFVATAVAMLVPAYAAAQDHSGIGLGIGSDIGLSAYHEVAWPDFVQGFLAVGDIYVTADYCRSYPMKFKKVPQLRPYLGGGIFLFEHDHRYRKNEDNDIHLGARLPLGMVLDIPDVPIHVSAEIVPSLQLTDDVDLFLDLLIAARFVF